MSQDSPPKQRLGDGDVGVDAGRTWNEFSRLQDDLRARFSRGERVRFEDCLTGEDAKLLQDPERILDLLYYEMMLREEFGDLLEMGEYLDRFPQFADPIRKLFDVQLALKDTYWHPEPGAAGSVAASAVTLPGGRHESAAVARSIPGYELIRELGRGGMGVVYLAWQIDLNRQVAVKMIRSGEFSRPRDRARLRAEAEAVARLDHPNLVKIFEVGEWDGRPFFSMEYVEGTRLADRLQGTPISPMLAAGLAETLARASQAAHERGVVHRDLTPNNVLISADGQPKIVDFGLSKLISGGPGQTATGDILGTPSYMAPEQAGGRSKEVGPATDVYALGAILYEMLTGRPPFKAETPLETLVQVTQEEPVAPRRLQPKVARDLENVCLKCLSKEPARRYQSALELAEDLRRYQTGEPVSARPVGIIGRAARWARHRPGMAAVLTLSALGLLVAFTLVTWHAGQADRARSSAEAAGRAAERQRIAAEAARAQERAERRKYQGLSARLLRDRALAQCEEGDVGRGLLWLAESLRLAPADDYDLQRAIRTNLAGWSGETHRLEAMLGHAHRVLTAVWSPDGKLVLTASGDRTARLWDATTGLPRGQPLRHPHPISHAAFSPGGATILTVSAREARIWTTANGELALAKPIDLEGSSELLAHAFSPTGDRLWLVLQRGQTCWLQSWWSSTGIALGAPFELGPGVASATFSRDARSLVTAGNTREVPVRLWETDSPRLVRELDELTQRISSVAFNPRNGRSFVTGGVDRMCRVWDTATGKLVGGPFRLPGPIRSVAFSPNGRTILAGGSDGSAQFWDADKGTPLHSLMRHPDAVSSAQFSPDGRYASTVSWDRVYLWDAATGEALGAPLPHPNEMLAAAFGPGGRSVLTRSGDFTIRIWQTTPARPGDQRLLHNGWVTAVAFRPPRGESLLTAVGGSDGRVRSWQTEAASEPTDTLENIGPILCLGYAPDGRSFAAGSVRREVRLWDAVAGRSNPSTPLVLADRVWSLAFSPDGRTLLTGIAQRRAEFWNVATGQPQLPPLEHERAVFAVAYSPDGRSVLTGSDDMTARLWDAATHRPLGVTFQHHGPVQAVAFRPPDGRVILTGSGDRTARLWDAATGAPVGEPFLHPSRVLAVAFSPDGRTFATGCGDGLARLWDTGSGQPLGLPVRHRGPVRAVAFGPGPSDTGAAGPARWLLLTGSEDMTARLHEIPAPQGEAAEEILRSVQLVTGMILDEQGLPESLDPAVWNGLRRGSPVAAASR